MDVSSGRGSVMVCRTCGKEFKGRVRKDRPSAYCSHECMWKAQRKREDRVCLQCGKSFHPHNMAKGLYCSRQCSGIALRTNACAVCGKWVPSGTTYCSPECKGAKDAWARIGYERQFDDMVGWMGWLSRTLPRKCDLCGADYCPEAVGQKRCRSCAKYLKDNHGDLRLWRNGRPDMSITLWKVYQRDKGYCRGCGRHLEFVEDYNSDVYPSIDHIVPLAKGGLHRWDNVQLMCRACNSIKCDDMPEVRERSFQTRLTIDDDWMAGWLDGCV